MKTELEGQIDRIDRKIMRLLAGDGRMSVTDLAKQVGISKTPAQVRLKKLVDRGYILGFRAILNPSMLAREHIAFTEVKLSDTTEAALTRFNEAVAKIVEVEQCHMIAGSYDYLLKVRTRDINTYRHVLGERISSLPHVASTSTFVSMQAVKEAGFEGAGTL